MGGTPTAVQEFRADISRSPPDRRAIAESGESQLGGLSNFRQTGRSIQTGGGVDQGCTSRDQVRINWSWIVWEDLLRAVELALQEDRLSGPVNAVSPEPVTNADFT